MNLHTKRLVYVLLAALNASIITLSIAGAAYLLAGFWHWLLPAAWLFVFGFTVCVFSVHKRPKKHKYSIKNLKY